MRRLPLILTPTPIEVWDACDTPIMPGIDPDGAYTEERVRELGVGIYLLDDPCAGIIPISAEDASAIVGGLLL